MSVKGAAIIFLQRGKMMRIAPVLRRQADKSNSDVLGSYTGTGKDGERPVQDADDL